MVYKVFVEPETTKNFEENLKFAPAIIKQTVKKYPPNYLYRYDKANQHVLICKYVEDGTVWVSVLEEYNPTITVERDVFGVNPKDLVACDLPDHLVHLKLN